MDVEASLIDGAVVDTSHTLVNVCGDPETVRYRLKP